MDAERERALIGSCRKGNRDAYADLVHEHSGRVFAICLGMLGDRHDAEDVAQQALLRGFMEIESLRDSQRFGAWIAQIARHLCIDTIRRRKVRVLPQAEETSTNRTPGDYGALKRALARLSPDYRMPLLLFYFDGRSTRSIAETLGVSQATIQTRLSRARRKLREYLGSEDLES